MTVLPAALYIVLTLLGMTDDMAGTLAYLAALPGSEMVPMLAAEDETERDYAVCTIMITTLCSMITLPLVSLLISLVRI